MISSTSFRLLTVLVSVFKYQELKNTAVFPVISLCICLSGSKLHSETFIQFQEHQTYKHSSHGGHSPVLHGHLLISVVGSSSFLETDQAATWAKVCSALSGCRYSCVFSWKTSFQTLRLSVLWSLPVLGSN